MMSFARISLLVLMLAFSSASFPELPAQEAQAAGEVVVAEGVGKDEATARKAAFRSAVGKVVGVLIDAETLVKNDKVIEERILEFSGGFIKTFDVLKVEKAEGDLIRVRIKATVERARIAERLADARITTKEFKGSDLLAEKMTKEEARKNSAQLLKKLLADLPNCIKVEVAGKPGLTADEKAVKVKLVISVDLKTYAVFNKKAIATLDKICVFKDTLTINAVRLTDGRTRLPLDAGAAFQTYRLKTPEVPKGYAIWLLGAIDGSGTRMVWHYYWVDAPANDTVLGTLIGAKELATGPNAFPQTFRNEDYLAAIRLLDQAGEVVAEEKVPLPDILKQSEWILFRLAHQGVTPARQEWHQTLMIAPLVLDDALELYRGGAAVEQRLGITDDQLQRVKQVKVAVVQKFSK
jgi:hypothetical protein